MSHLAAAGTYLPSFGCDLHRNVGTRAGGVTSAIGARSGRRGGELLARFDLLTGRYLHTATRDFPGVPITPLESDSPALPNSTARLTVAGLSAAFESVGTGRHWPAGEFAAAVEAVRSGCDQPARGDDADMRELPATFGAERTVISMARPDDADIGVAEVHDSITGNGPISYEDLGFAEPAEVSAVTILEGPVANGR